MLRLQTSDAHRDLEDKLALLSRPSDRQRFLAVLERFHGFHAVWETAIRRRSRYAAFHAPRSRLPHLRRDLAALGRTTGEVSRLPLCREAERLVSDDAAALGSLYVLEGSTLGGQVIARELAGAGWLPSGGLTYFNPYGPRTGEMWRGFRAWLSAQDADDRAATEGARRTFRLLQDWVAA
ncbi:biliverdin-producing heme oxygenase [Phenylobacterium sp.]|uniref:biliverdin-producing heme oxygenase n=1 Tax=Phenylobacterium sp. TaxID=1871053 RepID=UPI0035B20E87